MKRFNLLLPMVVCLLAGCGSDSKEAPAGESPEDISFETELTFATIKNEVFEANCISCHNGYSNYDIVKASIGGIRARVLVEGTMPPPSGTPLTDEQLDLLQEWVDVGAPE